MLETFCCCEVGFCDNMLRSGWYLYKYIFYEVSFGHVQKFSSSQDVNEM